VQGEAAVAGVYEFVRLGRLAAGAGREFQLVNPRATVLRIFEVADLATTLEIISP